MIRKSNP